eukprot:4506460-Prymnesium_polylepis.2
MSMCMRLVRARCAGGGVRDAANDRPPRRPFGRRLQPRVRAGGQEGQGEGQEGQEGHGHALPKPPGQEGHGRSSRCQRQSRTL